jgi:UrcA family protein
MSPKSVSHAALLAGAFGLALTASSANAQDYGRYQNASYQDDENVQVTAPRFRVDGTQRRIDGAVEKISLSTNVRYDDLDLRSRGGAHMLKVRVRDAAQDTCTRLAEAYPLIQAMGTNCYKTALQNGELRANAAIRNARDRRYED